MNTNILASLAQCDFKNAQKLLTSLNDVQLNSRLIAFEIAHHSMAIPANLDQIPAVLIKCRTKLRNVLFNFNDYAKNRSALRELDEIRLQEFQELGKAIKFEISILKWTTKSHIGIQKHDLQACVMAYYTASRLFKKWTIEMNHRQITTLLAVIESFLLKLQNKIGLCFHKIFNQKEIQKLHVSQPKVRFHDEIRSNYLSPVLDLYDAFDPVNLSILYLNKPGLPFKQGFSCLGTEELVPTGVRSYPCVLSYPQDEIPFEYLPSIVSLLLHYSRFPRQLPLFNFYTSSQLASIDPSDPVQIKIGDCFTFFDQKLNLSFTFARLDHNYVLMLIIRKSLSKAKQQALSKVIRSLGLVFRVVNKSTA